MFDCVIGLPQCRLPKFKDHQPPRSPTVAPIFAPSEGFRQQPEDLRDFMKESSEDF